MFRRVCAARPDQLTGKVLRVTLLPEFSVPRIVGQKGEMVELTRFSQKTDDVSDSALAAALVADNCGKLWIERNIHLFEPGAVIATVCGHLVHLESGNKAGRILIKPL